MYYNIEGSHFDPFVPVLLSFSYSIFLPPHASNSLLKATTAFASKTNLQCIPVHGILPAGSLTINISSSEYSFSSLMDYTPVV